jgi:ribonuclease J
MGHGTHKLLETYSFLYPQFGVLDEGMDIRHFESGKTFKVKHLEITPIHVDHSVPGAYGFIVKTSRGNIVYTGDFRVHGPRADMTREFIKEAAKTKPCALLCEGTRMSHDSEHNYTEKEVEGKVSQIMAESKGMVFCYFSMSNVDRLMSVYRAAQKNRRKLVISTRMAYIITRMREKIKALPDVMNDGNVLVYYRLAKSCTYCEKDYYIWEREFMKKMVNYRDLQKNQGKYVMHLGFNGLIELVYLRPKNADFIYSSSEHFLEGEENEEERTVWENWMRHFGIKFHKAHCSGHAPKEDLISAIKAINPKLLIPIHTNVPEEFKKYHKNVKIPEKGKGMEI